MSAAENIKKAEEFLEKAGVTYDDPQWCLALSTLAQTHIQMAAFKIDHGIWYSDEIIYNGNPPF